MNLEPLIGSSIAMVEKSKPTPEIASDPDQQVLVRHLQGGLDSGWQLTEFAAALAHIRSVTTPAEPTARLKLLIDWTQQFLDTGERTLDELEAALISLGLPLAEPEETDPTILLIQSLVSGAFTDASLDALSLDGTPQELYQTNESIQTAVYVALKVASLVPTGGKQQFPALIETFGVPGWVVDEIVAQIIRDTLGGELGSAKPELTIDDLLAYVSSFPRLNEQIRDQLVAAVETLPIDELESYLSRLRVPRTSLQEADFSAAVRRRIMRELASEDLIALISSPISRIKTLIATFRIPDTLFEESVMRQAVKSALVAHLTETDVSPKSITDHISLPHWLSRINLATNLFEWIPDKLRIALTRDAEIRAATSQARGMCAKYHRSADDRALIEAFQYGRR